jgi:inositol transport system permease protein
VNQSTFKSKLDVITRKYGICIVFAALMIIGTVTTDSFLTIRNITNVLRQISVIGVMALAEMLLIISGNIDLSLGSVAALAGMISVNAYLSTNSFVVGI